MQGYTFGTSLVKFIDGVLSVLTAAKGDDARICEGEPTQYVHGDSGKKRIYWKYKFTNQNLKKLESFELPNGTLEIFRVGQQGQNAPDIATYWVAYFNGEAYSLDYRGSCWQSDASDYPNWVNRMKTQLGELVPST